MIKQNDFKWEKLEENMAQTKFYFYDLLLQNKPVMRGFHGSVESADSILRGFVIFYNFIRKHQGIKCSPFELACPELKIEGVNKWLGLIKMAKKQ